MKFQLQIKGWWSGVKLGIGFLAKAWQAARDGTLTGEEIADLFSWLFSELFGVKPTDVSFKL